MTQSPHGYAIGGVLRLTIAGCAPAAFNGAYACRITGASTFTYPLSIDPGQNVVAGSSSFLLNLAGNYFTTSTLVYRNAQFEVAP
ncbi:MAG: hypothetical protein P4M15_06375 [Alphaproteobacteria bacterium]|nr:hypothetical protein [Alphaproteobacteria bacterium]